MIAIIVVTAVLPAKLWRYELSSPVGRSTFDLAAMPKEAAVAVEKHESSAWYGREVEAIVLDPLAREGGTVTIRLKGSDRPLVFVFASLDVTTGKEKPRETKVGLRCAMVVAVAVAVARV